MEAESQATVQTQHAPVQPVKIKTFTRQRHYLAVFFLSFMWGTFGVDRFYLGKWGTGIVKLITLGGFGLWTIVDLIIIMGGFMRDKQGRPMVQYAEYKRFSYLTVLIFAIVLGVVVLINGIAIILAINQLFDALQNGTVPGLDALNGLNGMNGIPEDLQQYY